MTTTEQTIKQQLRQVWTQPNQRRWLLLAIAAGTLLLMAFYTVTDAAHLANASLLNGADWMGYAVCHRITERSFMINGRQIPLCARCSGMYLGVFVALAVVWLNGRGRHADLPPLPILLIFVGFLGIMGVDGLNSYAHFFPTAPRLYEPRNWLRLLTGMGTGLAMGAFILPALAQTLWASPQWRPSVGSTRELFDLLLVAAAVILLLLSNQPVLLYVLAIASVVGLVLIVAALNAIFLLIGLRRDGQATTWRETAVPLALSLLLAVAELSVVSAVRWNLTGTMTGFPGL